MPEVLCVPGFCLDHLKRRVGAHRQPTPIQWLWQCSEVVHREMAGGDVCGTTLRLGETMTRALTGKGVVTRREPEDSRAEDSRDEEIRFGRGLRWLTGASDTCTTRVMGQELGIGPSGPGCFREGGHLPRWSRHANGRGDSTISQATDPRGRQAEPMFLAAYRYEGFWELMDTIKDKQKLDVLCESGAAPSMRRRVAV